MEYTRDQRIETLRKMMDELCAPDLTVDRANAIRPKLFELLEMREQGGREEKLVDAGGARLRETLTGTIRLDRPRR